MPDNQDDEQGGKSGDPICGLPPFPRGPDSLEKRSSAFRWAGYMIELWGATAPAHALDAVLESIKQQDEDSTRGWVEINNAMVELGRLAGPDDAVH